MPLGFGKGKKKDGQTGQSGQTEQQSGEEVPPFIAETVHQRPDGRTEINIATNDPQKAAKLLREQGVSEEYWPENLKKDLGMS